MILVLVLNELRTLLSAPDADAPCTIGGTTEGDPYNLGTIMAAIALKEAEWGANSLGDNLPCATLTAAIRGDRPRLFWISASHIGSEDPFLKVHENLCDLFGREVSFVVFRSSLIAEIHPNVNLWQLHPTVIIMAPL